MLIIILVNCMYIANTLLHINFVYMYFFNYAHVGGGEACVQVYVQPTSPCSGFGLIPIVIPIPLSGGKQILIDIRIIPEIFGIVGCATVKVDAPQC